MIILNLRSNTNALKAIMSFVVLVAVYGVGYVLFKKDADYQVSEFPYQIDKEIIDKAGDWLKETGEKASWIFAPISNFIHLTVSAIENGLT